MTRTVAVDMDTWNLDVRILLAGMQWHNCRTSRKIVKRFRPDSHLLPAAYAYFKKRPEAGPYQNWNRRPISLRVGLRRWSIAQSLVMSSRPKGVVVGPVEWPVEIWSLEFAGDVSRWRFFGARHDCRWRTAFRCRCVQKIDLTEM